MIDGSVPNRLAALDEVLDRLQTATSGGTDLASDALRADALRYVERAVEAAMAASGRARDNRLEDPAAEQIRQTTGTARALLQELRATRRSARAIIESSVELRRQAFRLSAATLRLTGPARALAGRASPEIGARPDSPLDGVRILLVGASSVQEPEAMSLLGALGARVAVALSSGEAAAVATVFHPDALVCDVPPSAAEALVCDLRRGGVVAPALAVVPDGDSTVLATSRAAGFADVLVRPLTLGVLARAVRAVLGV